MKYYSRVQEPSRSRSETTNRRDGKEPFLNEPASEPVNEPASEPSEYRKPKKAHRGKRKCGTHEEAEDDESDVDDDDQSQRFLRRGPVMKFRSSFPNESLK